MAHSSMEPLPATTAPSTGDPYSLAWGCGSASGEGDLLTAPRESVWTEEERDEDEWTCESAGWGAARNDEADVAARVWPWPSSRSRASGDEESAMVTMVFMKMSRGGRIERLRQRR